MLRLGRHTRPCCAHLSGLWAPRAAASARPPRRRVSADRRNVSMAANGDERPDSDFGARDPTAGELESNFTDRVLGNFDTMHHIRGPDALKKIVGLSTKKCTACEGKDAKPLDSEQANKLRNQVPGWQIVEGDKGVLSLRQDWKALFAGTLLTVEGDKGVLSSRQDWKVRNFKSGLELFQRIGAIAEEEGHHPDLHLESWNKVQVVLSTHSIGGLTENDFIMAAKINMIEAADLMPKKKKQYWA